MIHVILKLKTIKLGSVLFLSYCIRGERPASRHFHCISRRMEPESGFFLEGEKQIVNHIYIKIFIIIFLAIVFKRKNSNFKLRTKLAKSVKKIFFFLFRWLNILKWP